MHTDDVPPTRPDTGLGSLIRRLGDAADRWGTFRVLLTMVVAFHLVVAAAFAVLPPTFLASPTLKVLATVPLNVWGPMFGAVGILALLELVLPPDAYAPRVHHVTSVTLWVGAIGLGTFWLVGLTLPLLPAFGGYGNALGAIVWATVVLPLLVYTAHLSSRGESPGCGPDC